MRHSSRTRPSMSGTKKIEKTLTTASKLSSGYLRAVMSASRNSTLSRPVASAFVCACSSKREAKSTPTTNRSFRRLAQRATPKLPSRNQRRALLRQAAISDWLRRACQLDPKNRAARRQNGRPQHHRSRQPYPLLSLTGRPRRPRVKVQYGHPQSIYFLDVG